METLKYKIISSEKQYKNYCDILEKLVFSSKKTKAQKDEISLLTLLIRTWDNENRIYNQLDPVEMIHSLMAEHQLKSKDMAEILEVSKGYISDILNYKKGLSKDIIRSLSSYFKISQEAFNRSYPVKSETNRVTKHKKKGIHNKFLVTV